MGETAMEPGRRHPKYRSARYAAMQSSDRERERRAAPLWRAYWDDPTPARRNDLVGDYLPLISEAVRRLPYPVQLFHESGDLEGWGTFGLVAAIERFAPGSPLNRFPSYAIARIRGAVIDELRRLDWLPRQTRRQVIEFTTTADALVESTGRVPQRREVLTAMGAGERESRAVGAALRAAQVMSLNAASTCSGGDGAAFDELLAEDAERGPEEYVVASARRAALDLALSELSPRQQAVLRLAVGRQGTKAEIGAAIGVTSGRVCQIEAQAVRELRSKLADRGWVGPERYRRRSTLPAISQPGV